MRVFDVAGRCADAALALDGVYGERRTVPLQRPCFPIADNEFEPGYGQLMIIP
jgi:hypothetical protein